MYGYEIVYVTDSGSMGAAFIGCRNSDGSITKQYNAAVALEMFLKDTPNYLVLSVLPVNLDKKQLWGRSKSELNFS